MADFIEMGFGIERRADEYSRWWIPHLEASRQFVDSVLAEFAPFDSICVLGAGRLYDLPFSVKQRAEKIALLDADPSCRHSWRAFERAEGRAKVTGRIVDLTGSIDPWDAALSRLLAESRQPRWEAVTEFLSELRPPTLRMSDLLGYGPECIISLSLLSQIPIYWRERFERRVRPWGAMPNDVCDQLLRTESSLQEKHLNAIAQSGARVVLLLADSAFFAYTVDESRWEETPAHRLNISSCFKDYRSHCSDSWYWHVVPAVATGGHEGAFHRVEARAFVS